MKFTKLALTAAMAVSLCTGTLASAQNNTGDWKKPAARWGGTALGIGGGYMTLGYFFGLNTPSLKGRLEWLKFKASVESEFGTISDPASLTKLGDPIWMKSNPTPIPEDYAQAQSLLVEFEEDQDHYKERLQNAILNSEPESRALKMKLIGINEKIAKSNDMEEIRNLQTEFNKIESQRQVYADRISAMSLEELKAKTGSAITRGNYKAIVDMSSPQKRWAATQYLQSLRDKGTLVNVFEPSNSMQNAWLNRLGVIAEMKNRSIVGVALGATGAALIIWAEATSN